MSREEIKKYAADHGMPQVLNHPDLTQEYVKSNGPQRKAMQDEVYQKRSKLQEKYTASKTQAEANEIGKQIDAENEKLQIMASVEAYEEAERTGQLLPVDTEPQPEAQPIEPVVREERKKTEYDPNYQDPSSTKYQLTYYAIGGILLTAATVGGVVWAYNIYQKRKSSVPDQVIVPKKPATGTALIPSRSTGLVPVMA